MFLPDRSESLDNMMERLGLQGKHPCCYFLLAPVLLPFALVRLIFLSLEDLWWVARDEAYAARESWDCRPEEDAHMVACRPCGRRHGRGRRHISCAGFAGCRANVRVALR